LEKAQTKLSSTHEIMMLHDVMECKTFTATSINITKTVVGLIGRLPRSFRSFFDCCRQRRCNASFSHVEFMRNLATRQFQL